MKRRNLLKVAAGSTATLGVSQAALADNEVFNWKMVMSWPKTTPGVGTAMDWFVEEIKRISSGRLNITLYGAGELVPPFEVFNAVSEGIAELGHGAAYYWKGKIPEAELFTTVPFGLTGIELTAWFYDGGGLELLQELYKPFGVIVYPCGNSEMQFGGWFNKEIKSVDDLKGLKIRMPGIPGEVYRLAGATPVSTPISEIYTALQNGVVDAADWHAPWLDRAFGLNKVAKYYYAGWQEPGASAELMINEKAFNRLPDDLQNLIKVTCYAAGLKMMVDFRAFNAESLQLLQQEGIKVSYFPSDVLKILKKHTDDYLEQYGKISPMSAKILKSYQDFLKAQRELAKVDLAFLQSR